MSDQHKITSMRAAGKILSKTFDFVAEKICEGMTAYNLDLDIKSYIESHNAVPGFLGYQGYKYSSCISKNEEIVHGIPHPDKLFFDGDIASIDIGVKYNGYYADAARTFLIGDVSDENKFLAKVTEESFFKAIENVKAGSRLGDISNGIQSHVESNGLTVVRDLYSHGVGKSLHEEPLIPNYGKKGVGMVLYDGMTMAIEPMVNLGVEGIETLDDNWTIVTQDRCWSAHYENTILVTKTGIEILTIHG